LKTQGLLVVGQLFPLVFKINKWVKVDLQTTFNHSSLPIRLYLFSEDMIHVFHRTACYEVAGMNLAVRLLSAAGPLH
jgi:hypothetical protein